MNFEITSPSPTEPLRIAGNLDIYEVGNLRAALLEHLANRSSIVLDLSGIKSCDTAGLQLLLAARQSAIRDGKSFSVQTGSSVLEDCLNALGINPEILQPQTA